MELDWNYVKKKTLWHYEKLIAKLEEALEYPFVQEFYDHDMRAAVQYAEKIQSGYRLNTKEIELDEAITRTFEQLDTLGIQNYCDLVRRVDTKSKCERFLVETGLGFEELIEVLNYLFRWVLPFKIPVKELVDTLPEVRKEYLEIFKRHKIRSNLDVLETMRSNIGRRKFAAETGMQHAYLLQLAQRADLSRLAYVRGKTIKHLSGGGYDTLEKLAQVDIATMEADMTTYYATLGKTFADFKAVIPLDWMIGGARVIPKIIEMV